MQSKKLGMISCLVGVLAFGCGAAETEMTEDGEPVAVESEAATACPPILKTWEDPNVYPANANPYKRPGIFHAMSYMANPPIFVPAARIGETCTVRFGSLHVKVTIKEDCLAEGEGCVGMCTP